MTQLSAAGLNAAAAAELADALAGGDIGGTGSGGRGGSARASRSGRCVAVSRPPSVSSSLLARPDVGAAA
jgi:hypothetical protein